MDSRKRKVRGRPRSPMAAAFQPGRVVFPASGTPAISRRNKPLLAPAPRMPYAWKANFFSKPLKNSKHGPVSLGKRNGILGSPWIFGNRRRTTFDVHARGRSRPRRRTGRPRHQGDPRPHQPDQRICGSQEIQRFGSRGNRRSEVSKNCGLRALPGRPDVFASHGDDRVQKRPYRIFSIRDEAISWLVATR